MRMIKVINNPAASSGVLNPSARIKKIIFFCIFLFAFALLPALGNKEKEAPPETAPDAPVVVRITGVIRLVGTAHFPEVVISSDEYDWFIVKAEADKLRALQQQVVTVEAEETVTEMRFANGKLAGVRRELSNIRIISVEQ